MVHRLESYGNFNHEGVEASSEKQSRWNEFREQVHVPTKEVAKVAGKWVLGLSIFINSGVLTRRVEAPNILPGPHAQQSEVLKSTHALSPEQIQNYIEHDTKERVFLCQDSSVDECVELASGQANTFSVDYEAMQAEAQKNAWTNALMLHTHPRAAYKAVGIPLLQSRENTNVTENEDMPPSLADMTDVPHTQREMKLRGLSVRMGVLGKGGVWKYEVGEGQYRRVSELYAIAEKEMAEAMEGASKQDLAQVQKKVDLLSNVYNIPAALEDLKEHNKLAQRFCQILEGLGEGVEDIAEQLESINSLAVEISEHSVHDTSARPQLIKKYTDVCASLGVKVEFLPFEFKK